ncbi:MAG TPA: neutral zinc metallopeptidase [Nocardioidaceae bacterium]|nr:neutral zinc metallopeptidase [Nocardioidaceae bacterium]
MRFNPKARLDTSQVQVRRGGGGGGGLGFPMPSGGGGMKVGGGLGGLLVLILILVVSQCMGGGSGLPDLGSVAPRSDSEAVSSSELTECRTGEDANENPDCARLAVVNSIQSFWSSTLQGYREADTVMFSQSVRTGCGNASSAVGPFYCPPDEQIYLDTTFFKDMLQGQLGARGGDFAEAYVLAHEYGHHVQNLTGYMSKVRTQQGPESDAVRLELQADCLGGLWAKHATQTPDADGNVLIQDLDEQDIAEAINAAQAVGDDRIQQRSGGRVNPDQWTHGSAAARDYWFRVGYTRGDFDACDTFKARDLHLDG